MSNFIETKHTATRDLSLFGAFPKDDTITFVLQMAETHENGCASSAGTMDTVEPATTSANEIPTVTMVIHNDGWGKTAHWQEYPLRWSEERWQLSLSMAQLCADTDAKDGLFYYHYRVLSRDGVELLGGERPTCLTPLVDGQGERQLLVYAADYTAPEHFHDGVIYHIFVDRFRKTGVAWENQKADTELDEDWENGTPQYGAYPGAEVANNVFFGGDLYGILEKLDYIASLGTRILYLSPIFDAYSNHKYDTGDYLTVDKMFGGDEALRQLCTEADKRGIRVILDGVFNHTGADSLYFNKLGHYPTIGAYQSKDSPWADWYTFQQFPDEYDCWWGVKILPRVRSAADSYQRFLYDEVIPKWMQMGVYGWRLDVADELDDGFLTKLRRAVHEQRADSVLIGEVWEDASDKVSYGERRSYLCGGQLDGVMNYPLREALLRYVLSGDTESFRYGTETLYRRYPKWASDNQMNFLSTHDTIRILTALGGEPMGDHTNAELAHLTMTADERAAAKERLKLAYGILAALPGVPCVFYGDEVGMEGYRDPFCRRPFPWHAMDEDLLDWYRRVGMCRCAEKVLQTGEFRLCSVTSAFVSFERIPWDEGDTITVYASRSDAPISIELTHDMHELLSNTDLSRGEHKLMPGAVWWCRERK